MIHALRQLARDAEERVLMLSGDRRPRVTARRPCAICRHPGHGQVSPDGTIAKWMRVALGAFKGGFSTLGESKIEDSRKAAS